MHMHVAKERCVHVTCFILVCTNIYASHVYRFTLCACMYVCVCFCGILHASRVCVCEYVHMYMCTVILEYSSRHEPVVHAHTPL